MIIEAKYECGLVVKSIGSLKKKKKKKKKKKAETLLT